MDDDMPPEDVDAYDMKNPKASEKAVDSDDLEPEEAGFMRGYEEAGDEGFDKKSKEEEE